jgi:hypothetical protein
MSSDPRPFASRIRLRGSICEVMRGIVGVYKTDGFQKNCYIDERLLNGILPGDIWFSWRYIPAPAGWKDYRSN